MSCPACVGKLITKEERASVGFCKPTFGVCESERKQLGHSDSHTSLEHLGGNLGGPKPLTNSLSCKLFCNISEIA